MFERLGACTGKHRSIEYQAGKRTRNMRTAYAHTCISTKKDVFLKLWARRLGGLGARAWDDILTPVARAPACYQHPPHYAYCIGVRGPCADPKQPIMCHRALNIARQSQQKHPRVTEAARKSTLVFDTCRASLRLLPISGVVCCLD